MIVMSGARSGCSLVSGSGAVVGMGYMEATGLVKTRDSGD